MRTNSSSGVREDGQLADGSWLSDHSTERRVGAVYSTTLSILALAIDYRYLPIYQR